MLKIDILTLFPQYFSQITTTSIIGRATKSERVELQAHDLRAFGSGKHQLTDDRPFGGGAGMVMLIEPIDKALESLGYKKGTPGELILLTSAAGKQFTQQKAVQWSKLERICILCGHYEGVDERVAQNLIDEEVRIGDFVLTGGEPAAVCILDALVRLQPEVLGNNESLVGESHHEPGVLGYPQYSRPAEYKGWSIPPILLSGDHAQIEQFRETQRKKDE